MSDVTMVTLEVNGHALWLLPEQAVFLPESDTLVVADAHIGVGAKALTVLSDLVRRLEVSRIVFLGDFLHAVRSEPLILDAVMRWREAHGALELTLVRSRLDARVGELPAALDIQALYGPLMHRGLALCHRPEPTAGAFVLAGHGHPCVSVGKRGQQRLRMPCFCFSARLGVLPAFGTLTGMQEVRAAEGGRIFAATGERVFELLPRSKRQQSTPELIEGPD
jgi:metallophosphoesterase superfamily enzyme